MTHSNVANECFQEKIKELIEFCDNEYYMSALPLVTTKERAERGRNRLLQAIEEFKTLRYKTKCAACLDEIDRQIVIQENGIQEVKSKI
ncbi:MAG: hypothetical protein HY863_19635 [Chloroflexi bacterium]|nr:hypothetical protein [Chloroflexota bacterium]